MNVMPLAEVLRDYRDGDEHGWEVEFTYLHREHKDKMRDLIASVQREGIKKPILLGSDGRVWDGHHRLCAASTLGLASIPVTTTEENP